jgi:hypothetical protein
VGKTQVVSEITAHRIDEKQCADILAWRFQLYDIYNWEKDKTAPIPFPTKYISKIPIPKEAYTLTSTEGIPVSILEVKDNWFRDLENSSDAHWFEAFSDIYAIQAPKKELRVCTE